MQSWKRIGERVAVARAALGLTQADLGAHVGLERTAITKIELGARKLDAMELDAVARALHCSLGWLLDPSELPAVASHRGEQPTRTLVDVRADALRRDLASLIELGVLEPPPQVTLEFEIDSVVAGEQAAYAIRKRLGLVGAPITDISDLAERLGLYVVCESLGPQQPEGCTVAVGGAGAAVLNGSHPQGRQRFTVAHEIGHHIMQDPYSLDWSVSGDGQSERVVNAFAVHLLLPRGGVADRWTQLGAAGLTPRSCAITIAAEYGVSWSATVAQLERFALVSPADRLSLQEEHPRRGDYEELGVSVPEPIGCPSLSRGLRVAILKAYRRRKITSGRASELLRGTLREDDLPILPDAPLDVLWSDVR